MYRLIILLIIAACYSCVPHKKIVFLQKTATMSKDTIVRKDVDYKIQTKDRLMIRVTSYNKQVSEFFNLQSNNQTQLNTQGATGQLNTFLVKESGFVELPLLDSIEVAGLTLPEIQEKLQDSIRLQVADAIVLIALANFQVTVLGEVGGQGIVSSGQNRMTIFDAIALSGGATDYANRKSIKVVRKDGELSIVGSIDLTSRDVFTSEFYYLNPNDIVYVDRLKGKTILNNLTTISRVVGILVGFVLLERTFNIIK